MTSSLVRIQWLYHYFANVLFILDGDKDIEKTKYKKLSDTYCNIITLPENSSPEQVMYEYLIGLHPEHEILNNYFSKGITLRSIKDNGP